VGAREGRLRKEKILYVYLIQSEAFTGE